VIQHPPDWNPLAIVPDKSVGLICKESSRRNAIGANTLLAVVIRNVPREIDYAGHAKGIFLPEVELWDDVAAGQSLGRIVDSAGRTMAPVASRREGHVILIRHSLSVSENEALVVVVEGLQKN